MATNKLDPIHLEIVWNGLKSIADECFITIMRSAFSSNVKERHDHSTAISDARGRLIIQSEMSLPVHLASMGGMLQALLARFCDDIAPGDIFIANDPHVAGGTHLPDINMAMPVFNEGKLIGFIANIIHHSDVGGAAVGSMSGGLDEIYKEGLRIPVVRLYRQGHCNRDILDLLLLNMRLSDERRGDLNAQISACHLGEMRLQDMLSTHGAQGMERIFDEIIDRTAMRMRKAITLLPDGIYHFEDMMDDDGAGSCDIHIVLTITKSGEKILFDFTGTDSQVKGNFNLTFNATQSAICYSLKALLDAGIPTNQGIFDVIEIHAPQGSFVNCTAPAAVAMRANACQRVVDCVLGALAPVVPQQVIGAANGANTSAVFAGTDPTTGRMYVYLETLGGGMGARYDHDGKDGVQVHITNTSNLPVEAIEMEYPLRVEEYSLITDTGGAGCHRGGMGIRRIIRPIGHVCEFNGVGERFKHQPWGIFGGEAGASGRFYLEHDGGESTPLAPKATGVVLTEDMRAIIETPGAGGYGNPGKRSIAAIEEDLAAGKISLDRIEMLYPQWVEAHAHAIPFPRHKVA